MSLTNGSGKAAPLKVLIVEDDFTSRTLLLRLLEAHGRCEVAVDGVEALNAVREAYNSASPYDLVCLDIMMPILDGQATLKAIREFEDTRGVPLAKGVKIVMSTALSDSKSVLSAFQQGCEAYVVKPIDKQRLMSELRKLGLITAG